MSKPAKRKLSNADLEKMIQDCLHRIDDTLKQDVFFEHDDPEKITQSLSEPIYHIDRKRRSFLFRLFGNKQLKESIRDFEGVLDKLPTALETHNEYTARSRIEQFRAIIPLVESRPLDSQQVYSAVFDVRNRLVVAGAGTGKTTTVIGLVNYLLLTGTKPEEILLLSFTNASVDELRERIKKETGETIETSTFHKLGLNIISEAKGKRPSISHIELRTFISDTLHELCNDPSYANRLNVYLRFGTESLETEDSEYTDGLKIRTMKGETVKSYGEKTIADYLYLRGIPYVYEDPYFVDVSDETHTQYHPDFHISDNNVYIEYFGTDRDGKVAPWFTSETGDPSEKYCESMEWKKKCHEEHGTRLISLFYYQNKEGTLIDDLEAALKENDIETELLPVEDIINRMEANHTFLRLSSQFTTSIMLLKSCDMDIDSLRKTLKRENFGVKRYLDILQPIYDTYQNALKNSGEIDFEDMLNEATDLTQQRKYTHNYRYVIVDEYQDISSSRYRLLKAMRDSKDYHLFCVGDDWQSIYRFNGSDIGYIQDFERFWGPSKICYIEKTYRYSGKLLDLSGRFIQKNPLQIKKNLSGPDGLDSIVRIVNVTSAGEEGFAIESKLKLIPEGSSVMILGRYNFDIDLIKNADVIRNPDETLSLVFESRPDLKIRFMTAHGSKGLQADYVFIVNCKKDGAGFPNRLDDSPLLPLLLESKDDYPFAEERRLFYVALTRAKKGVFLVIRKGNISPFVNDLFE